MVNVSFSPLLCVLPSTFSPSFTALLNASWNLTSSANSTLTYPSVLERISSANLATFFSIVGGMSLGSAVLLAVAVAALSRGFVALVQGGLSPAAAYLRGRLGLAALLLAVALVVLSGVIASAVTPAASFMGVGIIFMVPGLSLLAYSFFNLRASGAASAQDASVLYSGYAGMACVWAWEAGVAGSGTLDSSGAWVYNFHAVGWVGLSVSFALALQVYNRLLAPRGTLEPRALAALALQWHRVRAEASEQQGQQGQHPQQQHQPAPLVEAFLAKGHLPRHLVHGTQSPEGYAMPPPRTPLPLKPLHSAAAPTTSTPSAASLQQQEHAAAQEALTMLPAYLALYLLSLAGYSAVHYLYAPPPERFVGGVLAATLCVLDVSLLACLGAGILDSPAPPLLASFAARLLVAAFPASFWLLGISSLFAVLTTFLGRVVLRRALLEGGGRWGSVSTGAFKAEAILFLVGCAFVALFSVLLNNAPLLPLPPVLLPGGLLVGQPTYAYFCLVLVALALALELCLKLWLWRDPVPLPVAGGALGGLLPRPALEWTQPGACLVALTIAMCTGLGIGFAYATGVWFAIPATTCPPLFAACALAWYGRWVNDGHVWWLPPTCPGAAARNRGSALALAAAAASLAAFGLSWQLLTPPLPSACAAADPFSYFLLPYLGYAIAALPALAGATAVPILAYFATLRHTAGGQAWAGLALALYAALLGGLLWGWRVWGSGTGTLTALAAAGAAYPGLVALLVPSLQWLDVGRRWQALGRPLRTAWVGGGAWVTAVLAVPAALSTLDSSTLGMAPLCALGGWAALCLLGGLRVWVDGRPSGAPLPPQLWAAAAVAGGLYTCGAVGFAVWEWVVNRSLLRSLLAASSIYAVLVLCLLGAGLLQLQAVGAFATALRLPRAAEALRMRLTNALHWGGSASGASGGSGGPGSPSALTALTTAASGLVSRLLAPAASSLFGSRLALPATTPPAHKAAMGTYCAGLQVRSAADSLAAASALAKVVASVAVGPWSGATPPSGGRRLLLPGALLPAYYYNPQSARLERASWGVLLVAAAALLTLLWALVAVVVVPPTLVGLLVCLCARTLAGLFFTELLHRTAAETQCALSLLGVHLGSNPASAAAASTAALGEGAVRTAILDRLLGLLLDEVGCPSTGRGEGGEGVEPYPYFALFPSTAYAARLRNLGTRMRLEAGEQALAAMAAAARSGTAALLSRHATAAATAVVANPMGSAAASRAAEAAERGEPAPHAAPILERLASATERAAFINLRDIPPGQPIPALAATASALQEDLSATLVAEQRLALGLLHRLLKAAETAEAEVALGWHTFLAWASMPEQLGPLGSLGLQELCYYLGLLQGAEAGGAAAGAAAAGSAASAAAAAAAAAAAPSLMLPSGNGECVRAPPPSALASKAALLHYLSEMEGPGQYSLKVGALQCAEAMFAAFQAAAAAAAASVREQEQRATERRAAEEAEAQRARLQAAVEAARAETQAQEAAARAEREAARQAQEAAAQWRAEQARRAKAAALAAQAEAEQQALLAQRAAAAVALAARQAAERAQAAAEAETERARQQLEARHREERAAAERQAEAAAAAAEAAAARAAAAAEAEAAAAQAAAVQERAARAAAEEGAATARQRAGDEAAMQRLLEADRVEYMGALRGDDRASDRRLSALLVGAGGGGWVDAAFGGPSALCPEHAAGVGGSAVQWLDLSATRPRVLGGESYTGWGQPRLPASWALGLATASPADPGQGSLGDCWLITALSLLSTRRECLARVLQLPPGSSGSPSAVGVRLWGAGGWKEYALDSRVPSAEGQEGLPLYCRPPSPSSMWAVLLEKAFAKAQGGYGALDGGLINDALCALIPGSYGSHEVLREYGGREDLLWGNLRAWHARGHILGAASAQGSDAATEADLAAFQHIVKGHAFAVLEVREVLDGGVAHRLLRLRNPWGNTEWDGPYSDTWEGWWDKRKAPSSLNIRVFDPPMPHPSLAPGGSGSSKRGSSSSSSSRAAWDDGTFYMPYSSWLTHFEALNVCRVFSLQAPAPGQPPPWHLESLSGAWRCSEGTVGGIGWDPMAATVPRFKLTVPQGADLFIVLRVLLPLEVPLGSHSHPTQPLIRLAIQEWAEGALAEIQTRYLHARETFLELDGRHVGGGKAYLVTAGCGDTLSVHSGGSGGEEPVASSPTLESFGGTMHYTLMAYCSQPGMKLEAGADAKGKCLQGAGK